MVAEQFIPRNAAELLCRIFIFYLLREKLQEVHPLTDTTGSPEWL